METKNKELYERNLTIYVLDLIGERQINSYSIVKLIQRSRDSIFENQNKELTNYELMSKIVELCYLPQDAKSVEHIVATIYSKPIEKIKDYPFYAIEHTYVTDVARKLCELYDINLKGYYL